MSDKVQLIKKEIERRFNDNMKASEQYTENSKSRALFTSAAKEDYDLLAFIDALKEESVCEANFITKNGDSEEAAKEYSFNIPTQLEADSVWKKETEQHFKDGAKYHEDKMKEALQTEYEKGRFDMMEDIMKNTVLETKVMRDCDGDGIETPYEEWLTLENTEIPYIPDNLGLKEGDKVKIIICKGE